MLYVEQFMLAPRWPGHYRCEELAGGTHVATVYAPYARSTSVVLAIRVGARDEPAGARGIAHLLEHVLFRGTRHYSDGQVLLNKIEGLGGFVNAATGPEFTTVFARVHSQQMPLAIEAVSELICFPLLRDEDVDHEKQIIREEAAELVAQSRKSVRAMLQALLWPDHPMANSAIGIVDQIAALSRSQVVQFHRRYYRPDAACLVVVGPHEHETVVKIAAERLSRWRRPEEASPTRIAAPPPLTVGRLAWKPSADPKRVHLALGLAAPMAEPEYRSLAQTASEILVYRLGGTQSALLKQELREQRALVYDVEVMLQSYSDTGILSICLETGPDAALDAITTIVRALRDVAAGTGMSKELIGPTKLAFRAATEMEWEDHLSLAEWIAARFGVTGAPSDPRLALDAITSIGLDELTHAGRVFLGAIHVAILSSRPIYQRIKQQLRNSTELNVVHIVNS